MHTGQTLTLRCELSGQPEAGGRERGRWRWRHGGRRREVHTLCAHRRRHWVNTTAAVWAGGLVQSGRQGKHQMQCAAWKCSECSGWCLPRGGKSD